MARAHSFAILAEIDEAQLTYEEQREGRGLRFLSALRATFARIDKNPLSFERVRGSRGLVIRRAPVPRFPYVVYFYVEGREVIVVAVAHGRRQRSYWRGRL